jgi:hypothetical protein
MHCALVALALTFLRSSVAMEVLGPVTDLSITNEVLKPDGTSRSTVVACSAFPGPLITGAPVS